MYKNRVQMFNPKMKRWVKLDTETGRILSYKSDKKPYKNVEILPDYREKAEKLLAGMGWTLEEIAKHMKL
jgi:hypothetical protein